MASSDGMAATDDMLALDTVGGLVVLKQQRHLHLHFFYGSDLDVFHSFIHSFMLHL
jgi:hypothetical protein